MAFTVLVTEDELVCDFHTVQATNATEVWEMGLHTHVMHRLVATHTYKWYLLVIGQLSIMPMFSSLCVM